MPHPTFALSRSSTITPGDSEPGPWAEWEARLDATDERGLDPAVEAQLRANAAVLRRYRAAMGGR